MYQNFYPSTQENIMIFCQHGSFLKNKKKLYHTPSNTKHLCIDVVVFVSIYAFYFNKKHFPQLFYTVHIYACYLFLLLDHSTNNQKVMNFSFAGMVSVSQTEPYFQRRVRRGGQMFAGRATQLSLWRKGGLPCFPKSPDQMLMSTRDHFLYTNHELKSLEWERLGIRQQNRGSTK